MRMRCPAIQRTRVIPMRALRLRSRVPSPTRRVGPARSSIHELFDCLSLCFRFTLAVFTRRKGGQNSSPRFQCNIFSNFFSPRSVSPIVQPTFPLVSAQLESDSEKILPLHPQFHEKPFFITKNRIQLRFYGPEPSSPVRRSRITH